MTYKISSKSLSARINKTGIELCSIKSKATGKEYMWQGNPEIWGSHAPVLFPIVGELKDGEYYFEGKKYLLPRHGLVRYSNKPRLIEQTDDYLKFSIKWDKETLQIYPFKFELEVTFSIIGNTIRITHLITNHDDKVMFYSVGAHPGFNCPFYEDESYEDYFLEFEKPETDSTWMLDSNGLVTGETKPMLLDTRTLALHKNLFDKDALIFKNLKSNSLRLVSKKSGPVLSVSFDDFNYLGVWAKPQASFVCIEPWNGIADPSDFNQQLTDKEGILPLEPKQTEQKAYSITIT